MAKAPPGFPTSNEEIQRRLRQGIDNRNDKGNDPAAGQDPLSVSDMPPTTSTDGRLPTQQILTCFYSTHDDACRNHRNILDEPFPATTRCIAIQGGADGICPPDTALDVLERWPTMELRVPVYGGHSMYDPYITHELVQATDRMATLLSKKDDF